MVGIYKITSPSNKVYIGQSRNINRRLHEYKYCKCKRQQKLYNSIRKYGWESHIFEICHELPVDIAQEVLDQYEQLYMDLYTDCNIKLLNLRGGGNRGKVSLETKKKLSLKRMGRFKGKDNYMYGRTHTEESKAKIREARAKQVLKPRTKEAQMKINTKLQKPVIQLCKDGSISNTWDSITKAQEGTGISKSLISQCCNNHLKFGKGYIWKFKTK